MDSDLIQEVSTAPDAMGEAVGGTSRAPCRVHLLHPFVLALTVPRSAHPVVELPETKAETDDAEMSGSYTVRAVRHEGPSQITANESAQHPGSVAPIKAHCIVALT